MVHDVLLAADKIEQPWLPGAAEKCRWVAERDWLYAVTIPCPGASREVWLRFAGLDTIVDVYLNGERIASHSNMYTPLAVEIGGRLRERNTIVLHFHTVFDLSGPKPVPIQMAGGDPTRRVRRPPSNYSTYLGPQPYYSRVGVYDTIAVDTNDGSVLEDVLADATLDETPTEGTVTVEITGRSRLASADLGVRLMAPDGRVAAETRQSLPVRENAFRARPALRIGAFRREHILFATLTDANGSVIARANALADIERRIAFPAAKLNVQVKDGALSITTDKFARTVTLEGDADGDASGWFFEDNYFDLMPGEVKTVRILGSHAQGRIAARPWYSPHGESVTWRR